MAENAILLSSDPLKKMRTQSVNAMQNITKSDAKSGMIGKRDTI